MIVNYNAHHLNVSEEMKNYFAKRMEKLQKFDNLINTIDVYFELDSYVNRIEVVIDFRKGKTVCFTSEENDMYKAIDDIVDRIERSVNKYKNKITHHKEVEALKMISLKMNKGENQFDEVEKIDLNLLYKKPLAIEDAIFQMEHRKNSDYFIFYNYENVEHEDLTATILFKDKEQYIAFESIKTDKNQARKILIKKEKTLKKIEEKIIKVEKSDLDTMTDEIKKSKEDHLLFYDKNSAQRMLLFKKNNGVLGLFSLDEK